MERIMKPIIATLIVIALSVLLFAATSTDNFNRADGALGASWTDASASTIEIVSNSAHASVSNSVNIAYYSGSSFGVNHYSQIYSNPDSSIHFASPAVRVSSTSIFYITPITPTAVEVWRCIDGAWDQVGSTVSRSTTFPATIKVAATGTSTVTITVWINGDLVGTFDDSSASRLTTGAPGIYSNHQNAYIDDWEGGDYSTETTKRRKAVVIQ